MTMTTNDDKGKAAEATICAKCKHIAITPSPEGAYAKCGINLRMDYVTGHEEQWQCSAKNKGQCPDYEERGDDG